ncbi:MAG: GNAT family N-acetyltransferase [Actinomycetota bacterium]
MSVQPWIAPEVRFTSLDLSEGTEVRGFCLDVISEVFGLGYNEVWHADLDRLTQEHHQYTADVGGAFLVTRDSEGEVLACGGLRPLMTRPDLAERFADRYPDPEVIGSIWRTYVAPWARSRGVGAHLVAQLEAEARRHGYRATYLHTDAESPRSIAFWERQGYGRFAIDLESPATVHMDRPLA